MLRSIFFDILEYMQAIILAAGEGLKIAPESGEIAKCLLKVGKKSVLEHNLSQLPEKIKEVIIVVGHLKSQIKKQVGNNLGGRHIRYVEQSERKGTAHALFIAKDNLADKFLVLMGDNLYLKKDMENCLKNDLCILSQKLESPERFGIIKTDNGSLVEIAESPRISIGSLVNCGLYVLDLRIFDYSPVRIGDDEYGLPQTIAKMSRHHPVKIEKATFWMPINTIQDLKQADKYLKQIYL